MSKDVDVALWLDSRAYHGEPLLKFAIDFIIVNSQLHNQFDKFKKSETKSSHSVLELVELLHFYHKIECPHFLELRKYGKSYLQMSGEQIDGLVEWVQRMRDQFSIDGCTIFDSVSNLQAELLQEKSQDGKSKCSHIPF